MKAAVRASVACVAVVLLAACGDDGTRPEPDAGDGGTDAAMDGGTSLIPWLAEGAPPLELTPCPEGWREAVDAEGGVTTCDPYPEGGADVCAVGEAHFPGEAACRAIGAPCPTGTFPEVGAADAVYVAEGAAPGGDGSRDAPYARLSEVGVSAGATIVIGKGTYEGVLVLRPGTRVVGACAAETVLTGLDAPVPAVIDASSRGEAAIVENLSVRGAPQDAIRVQRGGHLEVRGVLLEDNAGLAGIGVTESGSELTVQDVVIRGTRLTAGMIGGRGVVVALGGAMGGDGLILEGNREIGFLIANAGTAVNLTDVVVRDTALGVGARAIGHGIDVQDGATLVAERVLIEGSRQLGFLSYAEGTSAELSDVVIRDTQPAAGTLGRGMDVSNGGRLVAARLVVERSHESGVFVEGAGSTVELSDAVIRDTAPRVSDEQWGHGLIVRSGARVSATRLVVERNHTVGVTAMDAGTSVDLVDVVVRHVRPEMARSWFGYGLVSQQGAELTARGLYVHDTYELGIAGLEGAALTASAAVVENVSRSASDDPSRAFGFAASAISARVALTGFRVSNGGTCGLMISPAPRAEEAVADPSLDVTDGVVEGMPIGACVQVDGFDLGRLELGIEYRDNEVNLDVTDLPVPGGVTSL